MLKTMKRIRSAAQLSFLSLSSCRSSNINFIIEKIYNQQINIDKGNKLNWFQAMYVGQ